MTAAPTLPSQPGPGPHDIQAAGFVYDHVKCLWDDQVDLAETLVEKRKTLSTTLAIVIGLGAFRVQFTQRADDIPALSGSHLLASQILLTVALALITLGAYFLFTQRPTARRFCHWIWDMLARYFLMIFRKSRAASQKDADRIVMEEPSENPWPSGRAMSAALPEDEDLDDWFSLDSVSVLHTKTERLREAYVGLKTRNGRVSKRLRDALICLFFGYFLVFCTLVVYLWSIGGAK